ncbi:hypothetical protein [Cupriavidus taiwanensis]|uniref:hypothetical protein n=1 Tax=Cupriavidus taiwanensis TaxID=164546 RepID=UPI0011C02582|nr:hypothetical protein [Cupriavidus taiwanensis]
MQINFVSLSDVVRAIAPRVDVAEEEVELYSAQPANDGPLWEMLARRPARQCFQESRAAIQLLECLFKTSAGPRWFDTVLRGYPLQSEDARKEGRDELVRFVNQEQEFKASVERMRSPFARWHDRRFDGENQPARALDYPKMRRSNEIGFDRTELISYLVDNGVSYSPQLLAPPRTEPPAPSTSTACGQLPEVPSYLASGAVARAFDGCASWTKSEWSRMLGDAGPWLSAARRGPKTATHSPALWDPVIIARALAAGVRRKRQIDGTQKYIEVKTSLRRLDRVFEHPEMHEWRKSWEREREELETYQVDNTDPA